MASHGIVLNSLNELEPVHIDHLKSELGHDRVWAVGPLASPTVEEVTKTTSSHEVMTWLDGRTDDDESVVYVCFGSRTILTRHQIEVLLTGLDRSGVDFILCVDVGNMEDEEDVTTSVDLLEEGYDDKRVSSGRGFLLRGWAPQVKILSHRAVGTFVTHCGWNSTLEW